MKNTRTKKIILSSTLVIGILGLVDFLSKPLFPPNVAELYGEELGKSVGLITALAIDLRNSLPLLSNILLEIGVIIGGTWFIFLAISIYYLKIKKHAQINEQASEGVNKNRRFELLGGLASGLIGLIIISNIIDDGFSLITLFFGLPFIIGSYILLFPKK